MCGQVGHTSMNYTNEPKCPNCTGSHSAFSKNCPKWLFEKMVQQVKAEKGISFIEARKIVNAESEGRSARGGCTAAAVVASGSDLTPPATRSVQVQTDLTWPKGQEQPTTLPFSATSARMWANAQPDGRPAEHRWRPLFNAAVWLTPTTRCRAVTLPRRKTR